MIHGGASEDAVNDLARIYVKGGNGGNGKVSFRREKFAPKGGPDGGDGGRGGDVVVIADENVANLVEFNFKKRYEAENGEHGLIKKMHGKDRETLTFAVPVGTVVWELPTELAEANLRDDTTFKRVIAARRMMIDLTTHGQTYVVAYGGKGGRGNDHFKSSTNQTPMQAEKGQAGEERWLILEHKVVADVGIIGLPNVGKSSLLKSLTRANPKIAGYPFTTLEPNLGVLQLRKSKAPNINNQTNSNDQNANIHKNSHIVLVDVPGVIEEASTGKGIGPWFLRHLERTKMLIHMLAPTIKNQTSNSNNQTNSNDQITNQLVGDYMIVRNEIEKYGNGLSDKTEIVVVNKRELVDTDQWSKINDQFEKKTGKKIIWISAAMGEVGDLVKELG